MQEDQPVGKPEPVEQIVPLHAEQIEAVKARRETGRIRVSTETHLREQLVDEILAEDHAHVKRIVIGRIVDDMPSIRQEGDTTIIPVVEEVLVTEKRLFLKQEIHVTRVRTTSRHQETVLLRHQDASVVRLPAGPTDRNLHTASTMEGDKDG